MKTCPKCNELNGDNRTECFRCKASLGSVDTYYNSSTTYSGSCWMYVVSVLIPLVGIILGCIYIARREDELGKSLIITGVVSNILAIILGIMFVGCSGF